MQAFSASQKDAASVLQEACETKQVESTLLTGACRFLENGGNCPLNSESEVLANIQGRWRVVWSDIVSIDAFKYIPVPEFLTINKGQLELKGYAGPLVSAFSGQYQWKPEDKGFDFTMPNVKVEMFGITLVDKIREQQNRNYQIIYSSPKVVLVRTSAGGYTLLFRE